MLKDVTSGSISLKHQCGLLLILGPSVLSEWGPCFGHVHFMSTRLLLMQCYAWCSYPECVGFACIFFRSAEICKKRWDQMQQSLGRGPQQRADFVDKMELLVRRYAPYLLDEELDQEFVSQLQAADASEEEP